MGFRLAHRRKQPISHQPIAQSTKKRMGIHGLKKLIADNAPSAIKDRKLDSYFGRVLGIDASMHIYQFMAVVGRSGENMLTNENGEITSHLIGMWHRTARLLEAGIKPVYVFDGKPPPMKGDTLKKRGARREEARAKLKEAKEQGNEADIEKYSKQDLVVTKEHNEECKKLLRLMGVPLVEAPCEAEAQCAELCKHGLVYAVATEDMDALTFGTPLQARNVMAAQSKQKDSGVQEFDISKVTAGLGVTMAQFIDICILCGCDYTSTIKGIGPKRALELVKKHGSIEKVVEALQRQEAKKKLDPKAKGKAIDIPEAFLAQFADARQLFITPEVTPASSFQPFKVSHPDEAGLVAFLVDEKGFNKDRVLSTIARIKKSRGKASQGRLDSFFAAKPKPAMAGGASTKKLKLK